MQQHPTFLAPGTGFVEDNFSTDGVVDGSGGTASDGERWGATGSGGERRAATDEVSLAHRPLTSFCAAWYVTGRGPVPIHSDDAHEC